ncbi:AbrB/MazE/SpoVT family DNA-binding domain-containing protein [Helicobacter sp. MIT 14-3879]|uniref:AbrB/MazE/SpoVT family DNA-binding domain-containing protein n=1 Tax=Helicobacter sp. MIT 14-3879 TaxID=2040649 RepID=UPI000E1EDB33|nr:AbrB/MazE/SpoVT family DNA-binding domain-containing protein [Helicobacter sp. MIT 14-3879]RDU59490.1 hypothetical protein CQA44_11370 [Helicobacter sp. MIT 14-3879]
MTKLVKIGNSYGVRIPKVFIKKAHLEDSIIDFQLLKNGLLLSPSKAHRLNWNSATLKNKAKQEENVQAISSLQKDFLYKDLKDWDW